MILAGDIGGTKTNLAYFSTSGDALVLEKLVSYPSRQHSSFRDIVTKFLHEYRQPISCAAFGIAGPVIDGRCEATNLPWVVDVREIAPLLGLDAAGLINDLEATAYGALRIDDKDKLLLNSGVSKPKGTIAVIAAGTGLGEGGLVWCGNRYITLPSEGGHTDFPPRDDLEVDLLRFMQKRYERVSVERLVSGPGIYAIYEFFRTRADYPEPSWLRKQIEAGDASAAVSQAAIQDKDEASVRTMETFVSLYGAETGNLALTLLSTGGVYVAGGIAPKILPLIRRGSFYKSYKHKGRFSTLLESMPVWVVLNDKAALFGAAHHALATSD
jgi:glucokinase